MPSFPRLHRWLPVVPLTVLSLLAPGWPAPAVTAPGATPAPPVTVTLLTGDQVTLRPTPTGGSTVTTRPGPGRGRVGFRHRWDGRHHHVVPWDAAGLVARGVLDRALFDVTALAAQGYGRRPLSVIVGHQRNQPGGRGGTVARLAGTAGVRPLPSLAAEAVTVTEPARFWPMLTRAEKQGSLPRKVWLNGRARPLLDRSAPQVGAPVAWRAGLTGRGVPVAVLDTGIKADHPLLAGRIAESRDFTGSSAQAGDEVGHGTHVAGILAEGGRYRGIAPEARVLNGKVCQSEGCPFDAIIAGMEWAATRARVVNLSLGGEPGDGTDPLSLALNALTAKTGVLFVAAAGNTGADGTVSAPASADAALAVGSVTSTDQLSEFSSRGPRTGDYAVKPDLVAPGTGIVAARAPGTEVGDREPVDADHTRVSGTSMAAPHVAGAAALLAQAHPDWRADQLRAALLGSARPLPGIPVLAQGAGRLDLGRALAQSVTAAPATVGLFARWPHPKPLAQPVTYRNTGRVPVTLRLTAALTGPEGRPAPAPALGAQTLTVPAGSSASTTLTFDLAGLAFGQHSGQLTAVGPGGLRVATPLAVLNEPERYELAFSTAGAAGRPLPNQDISVVDDRTGEVSVATSGDSGSGALRLPPGRYHAMALVFDPVDRATLVSSGRIDLTAPRSVRLSAAGGRPVRLAAADWEASPDPVVLAGFEHAATGVGETLTGLLDLVRVVPLAESGTPYWFRFAGDLLSPAATDRPAPTVHHFGVLRRSVIPEPSWRPARRGFLPVTLRVHAAGPAAVAETGLGFGPVPGVAAYYTSAAPHPARAGAERLEYASPGTWAALVHQGSGQDGVPLESALWTDPFRVRAARPTVLELYAGVLGPAGAEASRHGDRIELLPEPWTERSSGRPLVLSSGRARGRYTLAAGDRTLYTGEDLTGAQVPVPAAPGWYTLSLDAAHGEPWLALSTRVRTVWRFRSGTGEGPLPLLAVRFAPGLDLANAAPGGRGFSFPARVTRPGLGAPVRAERLDVAVSCDGGRSWVPAVTARSGEGEREGWTVTVRHPAGPAAVALRATAVDADGNSVTQTIDAAYQVR